MSGDWKGKGSRCRVSDRQSYERTLRRLYGTRVKIPPPGKERDALRVRLQKVIDNSPLCDSAENVLRFLEEE